ncbi:thiamine-phosphate kinase [Bacteroidota bacterium]
MNKETEIIEKILKILPKSKSLQNNFFESDAEILNYNNKKLLFSIDEFSQEDFFSDDNPYELGKNVSIATISDILASGGKPIFYSHSITMDIEKWDSNFIEAFTKGIADVLNELKAGFIGGDLGISQLWKYTGVVIGEAENPITRIGATEGDLIYMTGHLGAGNIEAAKKLYLGNNLPENNLTLPTLRLSLRYKESKFINNYATSCIDSSDGVLNAINTISELNNVGYKITHLPYSEEVIQFCKLISKSKCLFFMGECGEYELVFTVKKEHKDSFILEANSKQLSFTEIGVIENKHQKILQTEEDHIDFINYSIKARDYKDINEYLSELINYVKNNRK